MTNKEKFHDAKVKNFNNGASVHFEKIGIWYNVICRGQDGTLLDKIRCDDYRQALEYRRNFYLIAKNH